MFALSRSGNGPENSRHFLDQSDSKLTCDLVTRALGSLVGYTLRSHKLIKVFSLPLIGRCGCDYIYLRYWLYCTQSKSALILKQLQLSEK